MSCSVAMFYPILVQTLTAIYRKFIHRSSVDSTTPLSMLDPENSSGDRKSTHTKAWLYIVINVNWFEVHRFILKVHYYEKWKAVEVAAFLHRSVQHQHNEIYPADTHCRHIPPARKYQLYTAASKKKTHGPDRDQTSTMAQNTMGEAVALVCSHCLAHTSLVVAGSHESHRKTEHRVIMQRTWWWWQWRRGERKGKGRQRQQQHRSIQRKLSCRDRIFLYIQYTIYIQYIELEREGMGVHMHHTPYITKTIFFTDPS